MTIPSDKKRAVEIPAPTDSSAKKSKRNNNQNEAPTDDEVDQFFAILTKMHVAVKYFETTTDGVSRGWRKALEDDAVHPTAGSDDKPIAKISDHFLLDLNAAPAGDDLIG
ncbi:hypothetical protein QQ045_030577 [Rhodiola kirilowii]